MRHGVKTKKLGRNKSHREATLRNLARSLFICERIRTTLTKAKAAQRFAERLLRFSQEGTQAARRNVLMRLPDRAVVDRLFMEIGPRFKDRPGGCTRIIRLGPRASDGAEMAFLELVERKERVEKKAKDKKKEK